MKLPVEPGAAAPLGAHYDGAGTNFALFSRDATRVELCLYDPAGAHEVARIELPERSGDVWHGYLPGVAPGAAYGYRVHGPFEPESGLRFNPHKLLLDPYARAVAGRFGWHESHYAFDRSDAARDLGYDARDNAAHTWKAVVTAPDRDPGPTVPRRTPWPDSIIYELHVRGFTMTHPEVPEALRGTLAGLVEPRPLEYLRALGITSVELLPVQLYVDEHFLVEKGLRNYWGYNPLNFFTPQPAYCASAAAFRDCVARLHDAGLEVILDVVYNHTAEGSELGPTLSYRGIDNRSYYRLQDAEPRRYVNDTGCGNTLDTENPQVSALVVDSLRYWAGSIGVDGFRFDLAPVLGRRAHGFDPHAPLLEAITRDPLLERCKLIAEPWDVGPGGYCLGRFPPDFAEWNDRYRDALRRFWRGEPGQEPELARRLHGSGDLFEAGGRAPHASINYVASHDGFTLRDLVSYEQRHNEANLEQNHDGHHENLSRNYGVEGPSDNAELDGLRWRQQRNFIATLLLSQGVPMLQAGDEFGRSQRGNNNAYCQDNSISWIDWNGIGADGAALLEFTRRVIALRREWPVLRADVYRHDGDGPDDDSFRWIHPHGRPMRESDWHSSENRCIGFVLEANGGGQALLVLLNASSATQAFILPPGAAGGWRLLLDSFDPGAGGEIVAEATTRGLAPRSLLVFAAETD